MIDIYTSHIYTALSHCEQVVYTHIHLFTCNLIYVHIYIDMIHIYTFHIFTALFLYVSELCVCVYTYILLITHMFMYIDIWNIPIFHVYTVFSQCEQVVVLAAVQRGSHSLARARAHAHACARSLSSLLILPSHPHSVSALCSSLFSFLLSRALSLSFSLTRCFALAPSQCEQVMFPTTLQRCWSRHTRSS